MTSMGGMVSGLYSGVGWGVEGWVGEQSKAEPLKWQYMYMGHMLRLNMIGGP